METKWYSDMWHLLMQPFKRGMDQVVESGTIKKGLFSLAFMTLAPIIPLLLFNALIFPLFPRTEFNGLVPLFVLGYCSLISYYSFGCSIYIRCFNRPLWLPLYIM